MDHFAEYAEQALSDLQSWIDHDFDPDDVEADRTEAGLELRLKDRRKIVISLQSALAEIWVAAPQGGFHLQWHDDDWKESTQGRTLSSLVRDLLPPR